MGTTVSEWTFYEPISNGNISYFEDSPDISAVDGADLNMDIQPVVVHLITLSTRLGAMTYSGSQRIILSRNTEKICEINARPLLR